MLKTSFFRRQPGKGRLCGFIFVFCSGVLLYSLRIYNISAANAAFSGALSLLSIGSIQSREAL